VHELVTVDIDFIDAQFNYETNPSILIVPHTNLIRSCSGISCIKSQITCSTASDVLEIYQASSEETVKEESISSS
jgi:hypothetical protein